MLLFWILPLLALASSHLVISLDPVDDIVSSTHNLTITILTTSDVPADSLTITFPTQFAIHQPCILDGVVDPCAISSGSSGGTVTLAASLTASQQYNITLNVTNPIYADNFAVLLAAGSTLFSNTGSVPIQPQTISCSLSTQSNVVGEQTVGTFTMSNSALPSGSTISINATEQSTFPDLFVAGPACSHSNTSLACTLTSLLSQQFLTITNAPTSSNLAIQVTSVNNPPYNGTLGNVGIQIQTAAGQNMQICSFQRSGASQLQSSVGVSVTGWDTQIGATSSVTITLTTQTIPYASSLVWTYPSELTVSIQTPATLASTSTSAGTVTIMIENAVIVGSSLAFAAQITNPPSLQPLPSTLYAVYSSSLYVQSSAINTMNLTSVTLSPALVLSTDLTMMNAEYNLSLSIPYTLTGGFILTITLQFGEISCSSLDLTSKVALTTTSCVSGQAVLSSSDTVASGLLWIRFAVLNHYSVRTNTLTASMTGPSPNLYEIGSGSTLVLLQQNSQLFTIINSNSVFNSATSITVEESSSVNIASSTSRTITLTPPIDLIFSTSTTTVTALVNTISSYTVNTSPPSITLNALGRVSIRIDGVTNPIKYNGTLQWTITATDTESNPSSSTLSTITPSYTSTTLTSVAASFSPNSIQASSTLTLTVIPSLQYYSPPLITIVLSDSLITTPCSNCTAVSSSSVSLSYFAHIMSISLGVNNSIHPSPNSISVTISDGSLTYQTYSLSHTFEPLTLTYITTQTGLFGELGSVNITVTNSPTQPTTLTYSPLTSMLTDITCVTCNDTLIHATGIILYFQTATVTLTATHNGLTYATASAVVSYVCSSIAGCKVCSNAIGTLTCSQCFNATFTSFNLLYSNQCLRNCPISTYSTGVACVACNTNCYNCDSTSCLECVPGYFVYNSTCVTTCPDTFITNTTHCIAAPVICQDNCANCLTSTQCLQCSNGFILFNQTCLSQCPTNYKLQGTQCIFFIPPQQTDYFPFPFVIASFLILVVLIAIKKFEKRSLVMGNLIAFLSLVQIGSMILTLFYTLRQDTSLPIQALTFIVLMSKVTMNVIFLIYFCTVIAPDEQFVGWREIGDHQTLYRVLIVLSSIFSFQIIRIIYSRLLGLPIFFGKFNTSLIFKPLNYFTLTYFLTTGGGLIALSVLSILHQDGYKTSAYFSSIETIIIEIVLVISCIVDNKNGYDDQFFEYQVYKVDNQYDSHLPPIEIQEQVENAGSMHQMLNAAEDSRIDKQLNPRSSQIVKNRMWVRKTQKHEFRDGEAQYDEANNQQMQVQTEPQPQPETGVINNTRKSLFRKKYVEDWRQIQKNMPHRLAKMGKSATKIGDTGQKKSVSPDSKLQKSTKRGLKRAASMEDIQHVEVRLPQNVPSIPQRIKRYFHVIKTQKELDEQRRKEEENGDESVGIDEQSIDRNTSEDNLAQEYEEQKTSQRLLNQKNARDKNGLGSQNGINLQVQSNGNSFSRRQQGSELIIDDFPQGIEEALSNSDDDERVIKQEILDPLESAIEEGQIEVGTNGESSNKNGRVKVDYRYQGQQKEKRYKTKRRRVNKQVEQVYLQRLVGSSEHRASQSRQRRLDF